MQRTITSLYPELEKSIQELKTIPIASQRKKLLQALLNYIQEKVTANQEIQINFICTHNSRRSHFSQIWAQTLANYFKVEKVFCYSGGTQTTALYPTVLKTLQHSGFVIETLAQTENPIYAIKYAANAHPIIGFSKKLDATFNPKSNFAGVLTCNAAEEVCPLVPGAELRIPITYIDPKAFDTTAEEAAKYQERSMQIASEMYYIFSQIKQ